MDMVRGLYLEMANDTNEWLYDKIVIEMKVIIYFSTCSYNTL